MSCARGCCETQAEHYRSVGIADSARTDLKKVTTHRDATIEIDVTEHWHERQDVLIKPKSVSVKAELKPGE